MIYPIGVDGNAIILFTTEPIRENLVEWMSLSLMSNQRSINLTHLPLSPQSNTCEASSFRLLSLISYPEISQL
ncbi:hypothetical protein [uncultured Duncaniella sp.]|uniref:hypothetical protein n=1 Tax=uncultured Duncaniella sp. TaxID=2768039 RepID=UPI0025B09F78|nr:hypothetical protein [uncultured Duncaniella sp.]